MAAVVRGTHEGSCAGVCWPQALPGAHTGYTHCRWLGSQRVQDSKPECVVAGLFGLLHTVGLLASSGVPWKMLLGSLPLNLLALSFLQ